MKKYLRWFNCKLFDVASGPIILAFFGIGAVIVIVVIALIVVAILLIRKATRKKKAENNQKHDETPQ